MKKCRSCKEEKELNLFVNSKAFKSGKDTICLQCSKEKVKFYRNKNKTPHSKRKSISSGYRDIIVDFLLKSDGLICGICKTSLENSSFHIDHKIPVALGGADIMENVQLTHPKCNLEQALIIRKQKHGY